MAPSTAILGVVVALTVATGGTARARRVPSTPDAWVDALAALPASERPHAIEARIASAGGTPIVADGHALFLAKAAQNRTPRVFGDFNAWGNDAGGRPSPGAGVMRPIPGTNWHALAVPLPADARIEYLLDAGDGRRAPDPRNPTRVLWSGRAYSVVAMPGYREPPEVTAARGATGPTRLESYRIASHVLGGTRTVHVLPSPFVTAASGSSQARYVYFTDGQSWMNQGLAARIIAHLIDSGRLPPMVAVFSDPGDRAAEYNLSARHRQFLVDELVPFVEARYPPGPGTVRRAIIGSSLGALAALDVALHHPDRFGFAGVLSLTTQPHAASRWLPTAPGERPAVFVVTCDYDWRWRGDSDTAADALRRAGVAVTRHHLAQGHNFGAWRDALATVLDAFAARP